MQTLRAAKTQFLSVGKGSCFKVFFCGRNLSKTSAFLTGRERVRGYSIVRPLQCGKPNGQQLLVPSFQSAVAQQRFKKVYDAQR